MAESKELKKIKKVYGERFMHMCRTLFPTLLETEGKLYEILTSTFSDNCKTLYETITTYGLEGEFKSHIYSLVDVETPDKRIIEPKTPYELLQEAGYELFECTSEEEIQSFKRYYAPNEELCTFHGGRLDRCVVFFAVNKDVDEIKRENFKEPKREDEYGTSVMGIQFDKGGPCMVSIKNRYNHTVNNPDATYGNDLERIAPGLTESFATLLRERGLELNKDNIERLSLPGYTVAGDGKYYMYNIESDGIYYCPGNMVISNNVTRTIGEPEKKLLIDNFVIDLENKTITNREEDWKHDSFVDALQNIEKIGIEKNKENGNRRISFYTQEQKEPIIVEINKSNQIVGYENNSLTQIGDNFLCNNRGLAEFNVPNLTRIGNDFLARNQALTAFNAPNLEQVGDDFLAGNLVLNSFNAPKLEQAGISFLISNTGLTEFTAPNLMQVEGNFLASNLVLNSFNAPKLEQVGASFLFLNEELTEFTAPNLIQAGNFFLANNQKLTRFNAENLERVGDNFLAKNEGLTEFSAHNLTRIGNSFLAINQKLEKFDARNLKRVGDGFLANNQGLKEFTSPNLEETGDDFLRENQELTEFNAPKLFQVRKFLFSE